MNYFKDCECQERAKQKYRSLAKKLHPDLGGTKEEMSNLTKQYEEFKKYGPSKSKPESIFEDLERQYTKARKGWDDAFTGDSMRFRMTDPKPNGQTAGWRTNKPKTPHEGYGDIPFDHPIRQELFNLRNRLAELDNTYRRPKPQHEVDEAYERYKKDVDKIQQQHRDEKLMLRQQINTLEHELMSKEYNLNSLGRVIDKQEETIRNLKSQELKFKNMSFFAKICYLFFPD